MSAFLELGIAVRDNGRVEQRVPCPQCDRGASDDALGVNIDTGAYHCFRCGWKGRAGNGSPRPSAPVSRIHDPDVAQRKRERLRRVWRESLPLSDIGARTVRQYLDSRGLGEIHKEAPRVLRAHPRLPYWDGAKEAGSYPAMVALFAAANGEPVTLHVTYLRADGCAKAPVASPKKILAVPIRGATKGGAIHLYEPKGGVLGICEGIESALSLRLLKRIPVWAAFCADNLERIQLPAKLSKVYVGVDLDESGKGQAVSTALATRLAKTHRGAEVFLITPSLDGCADLNDEVRRLAK